MRVEGGRIAGFATAMTGEVYAALSRHTILADTIEPPSDPEGAADAFAAGLKVARAMAAPGDLLNRLFAIRASILGGDLSAAGSGEYLSGLLIGAELADLRPGERVTIVGAEALAARYASALRAAGIDHDTAPADIAAAGLHAIAAAAHLITEGTT